LGRRFAHSVDEFLNRKQGELGLIGGSRLILGNSAPCAYSVEETPTEGPRSMDYFLLKDAARKEAVYIAEIARPNAFIADGSSFVQLARLVWRAIPSDRVRFTGPRSVTGHADEDHRLFASSVVPGVAPSSFWDRPGAIAGLV
jgi:hypothetical protein